MEKQVRTRSHQKDVSTAILFTGYAMGSSLSGDRCYFYSCAPALHAAIQRLPGQFMSEVINYRKNYAMKGSTSQKAAVGRERDKDTRDEEEKQHSNEERHQKVKHGCILKV